MLRSVDLSLFIDFSEQRIGPGFESHAVHVEFFCLVFEDEIDYLSRKVDN
jgi:hypothetical protein